MNKSKIEWTEMTLNPVVGCTYGCPYCYARVMNNRFNKSSKTKKGYTEDWSKPKFFPNRLKQLKRKKPTNIFMNSMSDIADWKEEWLIEVYEAVKNNPQHNYLFLTKRMEDIYLGHVEFADLFDLQNVWLGITITETYQLNDNLQALINFKRLKCKVFISIEPIHEFIKLNQYSHLICQLDWVIVGAETGKRKGKVIPKSYWVNDIIHDTRKANVPLFYKESMLPVVGESMMFREFPKELIHNGS